jgi:hypothetical protein
VGRYVATAPVALASGIVPEGGEFSSDAVPGLAWEPLDKDAEKAVAKANADRAERKAAKAAPKTEDKQSRRDPMVFQLRKEVDALNAEVAALKDMLEALTAPAVEAPADLQDDMAETIED